MSTGQFLILFLTLSGTQWISSSYWKWYQIHSLSHIKLLSLKCSIHSFSQFWTVFVTIQREELSCHTQNNRSHMRIGFSFNSTMKFSDKFNFKLIHLFSASLLWYLTFWGSQTFQKSRFKLDAKWLSTECRLASAILQIRALLTKVTVWLLKVVMSS